MSKLVLVNGPLELWSAPVGEAFPAIDAAPAGNWAKIGTSGDKNYTEDGVSVSPSQTVEAWRSLGGTFSRKAFRTEEDLIVTVTMADLSLSQVRRALNENAITSTAAGVGVAGHDEINLNRGPTVNTIALLVRGTGNSPQFDGGNVQFELDEVYEGGSQEMSFVKGGPVGVLLEFHALEDASGNVGRLRTETADPTG